MSRHRISQIRYVCQATIALYYSLSPGLGEIIQQIPLYNVSEQMEIWFASGSVQLEYVISQVTIAT